ncbi:MAG: family 10 glycosylhydrolase [Candidatus Sumerlaeales bacterium]|nr:family 10 glycosylhydrolase [Candidatus Sumerlaeales bacterium]
MKDFRGLLLTLLKRTLYIAMGILLGVVLYEFWLLRDVTPSASEIAEAKKIPAGAIFIDAIDEFPHPGSLVLWTPSGAPVTTVSETLLRYPDSVFCISVSNGRVTELGFAPTKIPADGFLVIARGVRQLDVKPDRISRNDELQLMPNKKWFVHKPDLAYRFSELKVPLNDLRQRLKNETTTTKETTTAAQEFMRKTLERLDAINDEIDTAQQKNPTLKQIQELRARVEEEVIAGELLLLGKDALPENEIRAVLVRSSEKSESAVKTRIQRLLKAGFNTIILEAFRWGGSINPQTNQGLWNSQPSDQIVMPISSYANLGNDYGMNLWLWVQNGFLSKGKLPAEFAKPEWLMRTAAGSTELGKKSEWLCLRRPEVREMLVKSYIEMVNSSNATCLAMDYLYNYVENLTESQGFCRCDYCKEHLAEIPMNPQRQNEELYAGSEELLTELRAALDARVMPDDPKTSAPRVDIAVFFNDREETTISLPLEKWIGMGLVDWVCPMSYFKENAQGIAKLAKQSSLLREHLLYGVGKHDDAYTVTPAEYARQIMNVRRYQLKGYQFFQAELITPEVQAMLGNTVNAVPAGTNRANSATLTKVDLPRPDELRGTWIVGKSLQESPEAFARKLNMLKQSCINTVMLDAWYRGLVSYPDSALAPFDPAIAATGRADAYGDAVKAIHDRGMKCVAWFEYGLFVGHDAKGGAEGQARQEFMNKHKDLISLDAKGNPDNNVRNFGVFYTLCPSNPASYKLLSEIMLEVVRKYPVDEVQFDRLKYANQTRCYCDYCRQTFETETGKPLTSATNAAEFLAWKREKNAAGVKILREALRAEKPEMPMSSYATWPSEMDTVAQSWDLWLQRDLIDYLVVGAYMDFVGTMAETQKLVGDKFGRVCFALNAEKLSADELINQMNIVGKSGAKGTVIWYADVIPLLLRRLACEEK